MKVAVIVGTRPEIIRLSCVIDALDGAVDLTLIHTGQNYDYELSDIFFEELSIRRPDHFLECTGERPWEVIGEVISKSGQVLEDEAPDAVLVLGDTNSCLAVIAAKRQKIPIFHMEAGNRCFDLRVPEEINRRIVDHTADVNLAYSQIARQYLLAEGLDPQLQIVTGSPMREVINRHYNPRNFDNVLDSLGVKRGEYFVISAHREENVDDPRRLGQLLDILDFLWGEYRLPIVFSLHPRTRERLKVLARPMPEGVRICKPFGYGRFLALQLGARIVLSDSGTITEESSILGFPAINLRDTHERPEGMEEASVMFTGLDLATVREAAGLLVSDGAKGQACIKAVADYSADNVSTKVLRTLVSMTPFVRRKVWRQGD